MDEIQNLLSAKGIKALQASTLYESGLVDLVFFSATVDKLP